MPYKKYVIGGGTVVVIALLIGFIISQNKQQSPQSSIPLQHPQQTGLDTKEYHITDSSESPYKSEQITQESIIRESQTDNPSVQRFLVKSAVDGSIRQVLAVNENDIIFENIQPQNWSPTDRFLYVYVDYPNRRDVIFIKTDGRFTNAQYYLHSTGIYPDMNVLTAKWVNNSTLILQTTNINTQVPQTFTVNFDDDTGFLTLCPGGPATCILTN